MTMEDVTSRLLDFNQEPQAYVGYLDSVVDAFYGTNNSFQVRVHNAAPWSTSRSENAVWFKLFLFLHDIT
jgi:hypothetical protein